MLFYDFSVKNGKDIQKSAECGKKKGGNGQKMEKSL